MTVTKGKFHVGYYFSDTSSDLISIQGTNPFTGEEQYILISEGQGKERAAEIARVLGCKVVSSGPTHEGF
jgi:hypothetical protein